MIWLAWENVNEPGKYGYERLDNFAVVANQLFLNDEVVGRGTVVDAEKLEQFLIDRVLSNQPMIVYVHQLPGWEPKVKDTRSIEQIF